MSDKRETNRKKVSWPAVLRSGSGNLPCSIMDVSQTGARVKLTGGAFLASECHLATALFPEAVPSRIVWRRGAEIGLRFKVPVQVRGDDLRRPRAMAPLQAGSWRIRL